MICEDGEWRDQPNCGSGEYCDRRNGTCAPIFAGCNSLSPGDIFCQSHLANGGSDAVTCGPDLVSGDVEPCIFECKDTVGCLAPVDNELVLEKDPPPIATDRLYWPGPTIPVCEENPGLKEWATVEDEAGASWGRYGGIAFTGWGECDDSFTGVVVTLKTHAETCDDGLGSIDYVGYPGPGRSVHITICTRYSDTDSTQNISDALLRVVTRHELGHVLGFPDATILSDPYDFMARGVDTTELDNLAITPGHIAMLVEAYGRKPPGAFVDQSGNCITLVNGVLGVGTCDGSADQTFRFAGGELMHPATGECLAVTEDTAAPAACTSGSPAAANQDWQPLEVQIRGFGGQCLQIERLSNGADPPVVVPTIEVDVCADFGTADALWRIEDVDGAGTVRLHQGDTNCLRVDPVKPTAVLDGCDCAEAETNPCKTVDRFTLNAAGQIRLGNYCLASRANGDTPESGSPRIDPCSLASSMLWNLSGRIESAAGMALARPVDPGAPVLVSQAIGARPPNNQLFDFYFSDSTP